MKNSVLTCWYCGHEVSVETIKAGIRVFHPDCQLKFEKEQDKLKSNYLKLKTEVMYQRALREMEKQDRLYISDYYDEAELVHEMSKETPTKFQSSDEMMVAMELVNKRIHAKPQFKIGRRRVDFLLPDLNVALEIDGFLHEFKVVKDSAREIEIMNNLHKKFGGNWEVIRIPTKFVEKDLTKLVEAIKTLYDVRQKLRKKNGGFIPTYWNRTNKVSQIKALRGIRDKTLDSIDKKELYHPQRGRLKQ